MQDSNKKQIIVSVAVMAIIVIAVIGVVATGKKKIGDTAMVSKTETVATTPTTTTTDTTASTDTTGTASSGSTYKDGTYSAKTSYDTPGGTDSITVSLTLRGDTVTATSASGTASSGEGEEYVDNFIDGYKSLVVGKKINAISLSRVSGSSLTSQGFNDALKQIESQAKA